MSDTAEEMMCCEEDEEQLITTSFEMVQYRQKFNLATFNLQTWVRAAKGIAAEEEEIPRSVFMSPGLPPLPFPLPLVSPSRHIWNAAREEEEEEEVTAAVAEVSITAAVEEPSRCRRPAERVQHQRLQKRRSSNGMQTSGSTSPET